jgi:protein-S-isoprenylcysteine O-methyltransferase Ste14
MKIYITGLLSLIIYLPIFLFMFKKDFRKRFSKINSKTSVDFLIEITTGILYFLVILYAFMEPIKIGWTALVGVLFYSVGLILTYRGYYIFYNEKGLITTDVFAISRNPTYFFGFVAIFGIVMMTNSLIILGLHILLFFLTDKIIINEEKYLIRKYKEQYLRYRKKVRKWI